MRPVVNALHRIVPEGTGTRRERVAFVEMGPDESLDVRVKTSPPPLGDREPIPWDTVVGFLMRNGPRSHTTLRVAGVIAH